VPNPNDCLVVFKAMSHARRVRQLVQRDDRYVEILRPPHALASGGCCAALRCPMDSLAEIASAAKSLNIEVGGQYRERTRAQSGNGVARLEYIALSGGNSSPSPIRCSSEAISGEPSSDEEV
jgi:hypothetical protein